jgi:hypothetical protein
VFDDDYDEPGERSEKRIEAFLYNIELLFGARKGSVRNAMRKLFK